MTPSKGGFFSRISVMEPEKDAKTRMVIHRDEPVTARLQVGLAQDPVSATYSKIGNFGWPGLRTPFTARRWRSF